MEPTLRKLKLILIALCLCFTSAQINAQFSISIGTKVASTYTNQSRSLIPNSLTIQKGINNNFEIRVNYSRIQLSRGVVIDFGERDLASMKSNNLGLFLTKYFWQRKSHKLGFYSGLNYRLSSVETVFHYNVSTNHGLVEYSINGFGIPLGLQYELHLSRKLKLWSSISYERYFRGAEPNQLLVDLNLGYIISPFKAFI